MNSIERIQKSLSAFDHFDSMQKTLESINSSMLLENNIASLKFNDSVERMIKSINYADTIQESIAALNVTNSFRKILESVKHQAMLPTTLDTLTLSDSIERMVKSANYTNTFQETISALNFNDSFQKMVESLNYEKTLNSFRHTHDLAGYMQNIGSFLAKPTILEHILDSNQSWDISDAEVGSIEQEELDRYITPLSESKNGKVFLSNFIKLPPVIQAFIVFFFLHIFLPQLNNICSDILSPYVNEVLTLPNKTKKEFVKHIKQIPASSLGIDTSEIRFITGTNVRLRQNPSTSSAILDELDIGQIVTILNKKKNWIQVQVTYEEEQLMGWVFTRYTAKFKN